VNCVSPASFALATLVIGVYGIRVLAVVFAAPIPDEH
jgi:hypothetical protein